MNRSPTPNAERFKWIVSVSTNNGGVHRAYRTAYTKPFALRGVHSPRSTLCIRFNSKSFTSTGDADFEMVDISLLSSSQSVARFYHQHEFCYGIRFIHANMWCFEFVFKWLKHLDGTSLILSTTFHINNFDSPKRNEKRFNGRNESIVSF